MSSQAANWDGVSKISHFINRCSGLFKMLICGRHNPGAIHICLRDFTPGLIQPGRGYVEVFGGISLIGDRPVTIWRAGTSGCLAT